MTPTPSAGILLYRGSGEGLQVWIGHMGGPYWSRKHRGAWSIPKGEQLPGEETLVTALREFEEEIGVAAPATEFRLLGEFAYSSGKRITVFAGSASEFDPGTITGGTFEMEWPPRSGRTQSFPELDRAAWVPVREARELLVAGQAPAIDAIRALLAS
jgi:predicted NUDIX family NTP pyrophosphohydrolase